jgi:hypothetical protein
LDSPDDGGVDDDLEPLHHIDHIGCRQPAGGIAAIGEDNQQGPPDLTRLGGHQTQIHGVDERGVALSSEILELSEDRRVIAGQRLHDANSVAEGRQRDLLVDSQSTNQTCGSATEIVKTFARHARSLEPKDSEYLSQVFQATSRTS